MLIWTRLPVIREQGHLIVKRQACVGLAEHLTRLSLHQHLDSQSVRMHIHYTNMIGFAALCSTAIAKCKLCFICMRETYREQ
jgi:hypothetical protein